MRRRASRPERKIPVSGDFAEPSDGLEPSTPSLPWRCSASCAKRAGRGIAPARGGASSGPAERVDVDRGGTEGLGDAHAPVVRLEQGSHPAARDLAVVRRRRDEYERVALDQCARDVVETVPGRRELAE